MTRSRTTKTPSTTGTTFTTPRSLMWRLCASSGATPTISRRPRGRRCVERVADSWSRTTASPSAIARWVPTHERLAELGSRWLTMHRRLRAGTIQTRTGRVVGTRCASRQFMPYVGLPSAAIALAGSPSGGVRSRANRLACNASTRSMIATELPGGECPPACGAKLDGDGRLPAGRSRPPVCQTTKVPTARTSRATPRRRPAPVLTFITGNKRSPDAGWRLVPHFPVQDVAFCHVVPNGSLHPTRTVEAD